MPQASLKGLAIHMVILLKASKNVRSFLAFFDKAKGGKISKLQICQAHKVGVLGE
jgi:hypothetical protein